MPPSFTFCAPCAFARRVLRCSAVPLSLLGCSAGILGCGGASSPPAPPQPLTFTLAASAVTSFPAQPAVTVAFQTTGGVSNAAILPTFSGLPAGVAPVVETATAATSGSIAIGAGTALPGTYAVIISATDGVTTLTQPLMLTIGVTAVISSTATTPFKEAMSTSFYMASDYSDAVFDAYPAMTPLLNTLAPNHVRMQVKGETRPETSDGVWDFSNLDSSVQPVMAVADHSPEFQIASPPAFLYQGLTTNFVNSTFLSGFSDYAANLVRYYNKGGFTANGTHYASPGATPIGYWGIYNEPNYNNVSPADYVAVYNATVPAMQAVDPSIKFIALELGGGYSSIDQPYVTAFAQGVTAQVDVVATHYYSTCQQTDTDATVMATIPSMAADARYVYQLMHTNTALAQTPLWVLENNVNADYATAGGKSACNPAIDFVDDLRGSSAFIAAWRPYVFSQVGQAGVQALYHWDFAADPQYGEYNVAAPAGQVQLAYWVDYWLGQLYPSTVTASVLNLTNTDSAGTEVFALKQASGAIVVMVCDHAVAGAQDNNGTGLARTVLLDLSALGSFQTATQITLDGATNLTTGPAQKSVPFAPQMQVALGGYGVTFLKLQ